MWTNPEDQGAFCDWAEHQMWDAQDPHARKVASLSQRLAREQQGAQWLARRLDEREVELGLWRIIGVVSFVGFLAAMIFGR